MMAACHAALTTFELLERILLSLPLHNILLLNTVNSQWRSVMARSIPIRNAMFKKHMAGYGSFPEHPGVDFNRNKQSRWLFVVEVAEGLLCLVRSSERRQIFTILMPTVSNTQLTISSARLHVTTCGLSNGGWRITWDNADGSRLCSKYLYEYLDDAKELLSYLRTFHSNEMEQADRRRK